ncbi:MAG: GNAT family N-acetyltransferase [Anaerolineae bacterium]|nr:GNAT family N-acetyltransferase [Anaerolineae bacterium]
MDDNTVILRPFRWDDLPALVDVTDAAADADQEQERFTVETLREELTLENDPEADCVVAVTPAGKIVGYAYVEFQDDADRVWGYGWGAVHPDRRRQGIGTRLVSAADARFAERLDAEAHDDRPAFIQRFLNAANPGVFALAQAQGYTKLRASYRMGIALDRPVDPGPLPDGFVLRPFDPDRHAQAVFEVDQAAFLDGGGQTIRMDYDDWHAHYIATPKFIIPLWLIAWTGDAIAGVCISQPWGEDDPALGWISRLGVLQQYRGRGLGESLLRHGFQALQQQGFVRAALGVRADSPAALHLYQRVGMQVYSHYVHYRKVLRGRAEDIQS